jgi:integrase
MPPSAISRTLMPRRSKPMMKLADKSRNHHRNAIKTFLRWCGDESENLLGEVQLTKLLKAKGMEADEIDETDPEFYRPDALQKLLDAADEELRPVIALRAFAGLRMSEALRIRWEEVYKREGYVTIDARIAKGRYRRIVRVLDSLAAWLAPYREHTGRWTCKHPKSSPRKRGPKVQPTVGLRPPSGRTLGRESRAKTNRNQRKLSHLLWAKLWDPTKAGIFTAQPGARGKIACSPSWLPDPQNPRHRRCS